MAAVFGAARRDRAHPRAASTGYVVIANINCHSQAVIGGASDAVDAAIAAFTAPGMHGRAAPGQPRLPHPHRRAGQRCRCAPCWRACACAAAHPDGRQRDRRVLPDGRRRRAAMIDLLGRQVADAGAVRQGPAHALRRRRARLRRGRPQAGPARLRRGRARRPRRRAGAVHQPPEAGRRRLVQPGRSAASTPPAWARCPRAPPQPVRRGAAPAACRRPPSPPRRAATRPAAGVADDDRICSSAAVRRLPRPRLAHLRRLPRARPRPLPAAAAAAARHRSAAEPVVDHRRRARPARHRRASSTTATWPHAAPASSSSTSCPTRLRHAHGRQAHHPPGQERRRAARSFEAIDDPADVIKLAGRARRRSTWGASSASPTARVEASTSTTLLAIGAGFDALRDAGIPLVMRYKTTTLAPSCPTAGACPRSCATTPASSSPRAFPGYDRFAEELERLPPRPRPARAPAGARGAARRAMTGARARRWPRSTAASPSCAPSSRPQPYALRPPLPLPRAVDGPLAVRRADRRARPQHADQLRLRHAPRRPWPSPRTGSAPAAAAA